MSASSSNYHTRTTPQSYTKADRHHHDTQSRTRASSRTPTKTSGIPTPQTSAKPAQHVSQLARRTSRTFTPEEHRGHGVAGSVRPAANVAGASSMSTTAQRSSATSPAESSSARPSARSISRSGALAPPPPIRTPSLAGSSVSTFDSPRSNGLRRKASVIESYAASRRADKSGVEVKGTAKSQPAADDPFENSVLGISLPESSSYIPATSPPMVEPKARFPQDVFKQASSSRLVAASPFHGYAPSATPSTRYADSPFSHVPTPSSASSYSSVPATVSNVTSPRSPPPAKSTGTSRPSTRGESSRLGLPPVRESSTSSSTSTIKAAGRPHISVKDGFTKPAIAPPVRPSTTSSTSTSTSRPRLTKTPSQSKPSNPRDRASGSVPPELAHLNVEPSTQASPPKALPPARPSRDGAPFLEGITTASPVVQSDLPRLYTTYHKRTPSQEPRTTPQTASPSFKSRFGFGSKSPAKGSSPRVDSAISPPPVSASAFHRPTSAPRASVDVPRLMRKDSPAVAPVSSPTKTSRFGFFSRKSKDEPRKVLEKPKRASTKGPAAGTGHEGYGRFNTRAHTGSASSSTSSLGVRSASADSLAAMNSVRPSGQRKGSVGSKVSRKSGESEVQLDEFLRDRLAPVVLRGSGSTESNATSSALPVGAVADSSKTSLESFPEPHLRLPATSKNAGISPSKIHPAFRSGYPVSESSDDEHRNGSFTNLATRRSLTRISRSQSRSPVRVPAPIKTSFIAVNKASLDSNYDAEGSAGGATDSMSLIGDPLEGHEGLWMRPLAARKGEKRAKSPSRWNFFQRAHGPSPRLEESLMEAEIDFEPSHSKSPIVSRGMGYPMLESLQPVGLEEVERIVFETTSADDSMSEDRSSFAHQERRQTKLLPSPPPRQYSSDSDFRSPLQPPSILVRLDSAESPELMRAQMAKPEKPANPPQVVTIQRSPSLKKDEFPAHRRDTSSGIPLPTRTPEPKDTALTVTEASGTSPARVPRLSPVGRIPKVKSNRDRAIELSSNSFSRPFGPTKPKPSVKPPGSLYSSIRELASPTETTSQPVSSTSTRSDGHVNGPKSSSIAGPAPTSAANDAHPSTSEFLYIPRKDSDVSYSSSSGTYSLLAYAPIAPQVDDVWNEFDDLLDEVDRVLPTHTTPLSTSSSLGAPFQYANMLSDYVSPPSTMPPPPPSWAGRPTALPVLPSAVPQIAQYPPVPFGQEVLSVPQQIARFMQPSLSPLATPSVVSHPMGYHGNRSTSTVNSNGRPSSQFAQRGSMAVQYQNPTASTTGGGERASVASSGRNSRASQHSRSASLPEGMHRASHSSLASSARYRRDTQLLDIAEVDADSQTSMANLRFGALMTSKWLSFGRVLFSPAHNEMRLADSPRVLILDGMGSDWSYYVALSYPSAAVYSLGPAPPKGQSAWPGVNQKPPPNHRSVAHESIDSPFPFPKGFFTAVVFRFPAATTDEAYHACLFECKRVLRPGGYLEVAVLDLDLMNMGARARQAVRGLKTRLQQRDPNVSLRNLSDALVRLIGRRGFDDIQRCLVGVPVAGRIPRSTDVSMAEGLGASSSAVFAPACNPAPEHAGGKQEEKEFSFADLLDDARANRDENSDPLAPPANQTDQKTPQHQQQSSTSQTQPAPTSRRESHDAAITKMVAKVGRWWYSMAYEARLLTSDRSIWNDVALLRECEKQGTSFRLLICCAQKPAAPRRRTVSV